MNFYEEKILHYIQKIKIKIEIKNKNKSKNNK